MSVKSFFKSTAFKCIAVLLSIVLICGIFLTFCNSLFYVSDAEKRERSIQKIYGKPVQIEAVDYTTEQATVGKAQILEAYKVEDGNYLIKSMGKDGFEGGTVTCWIVVEMTNGKIAGIGKMVYESNEKQSYIGTVNGSTLYQNIADATYTDDLVYTPETFKAAGASRSSNAVCNSANGALAFVKSVVLGVSIAEPTIYDNYQYINYIDTKKTTHEFKDGGIVYHVVTNGYGAASPFEITIAVADQKVKSLTITKEGSTDDSFASKAFKAYEGKNLDEVKAIMANVLDDNGEYKNPTEGEIKTGATNSGFNVGYAVLFALANYEAAINDCWQYTNYIDLEKTTYTVAEGVATYTVTTKQVGAASPFNITVVIEEQKVKSLTITKDGSTDASFGSKAFKAYEGKNLEDVKAIMANVLDDNGEYKNPSEGEIKTGATNSGFAIGYSVLYALANTDLAIFLGGANNG